jgi:peptide-methionine (R)-S-oxide reductase
MKDDSNLDPLLKKVAREGGTEAPYSGKYLAETAAGTYACAVCGNALFPSTAKFETKLPGLMGWPSFEDALPGAIIMKHDPSYGMNRTEILCANCESHLGHVFDDLPRSGEGKAGESETKTGKHYCVNSVCLDLKRSDK